MATFEDFTENFLLAVDFKKRPDIDEKTKLSELAEFDSLAMLGTIVMFEIDYDKTVTAENILACKHVYDLFLLSESA